MASKQQSSNTKMEQVVRTIEKAVIETNFDLIKEFFIDGKLNIEYMNMYINPGMLLQADCDHERIGKRVKLAPDRPSKRSKH